MAFTTKIIHDSSPDMGDSPVEVTEQGRPESVGLQGLTPNTVRYVRAELYQDGTKVDTDETSFQTLPVGSMTVTYGQYRRTGCHEHYVTYTYTSTYAPSSAILHVTSAGGFTANYQGAIDSRNNSILFDCDDWAGGVVYSCSATLTDVYGAEQTSAVTTLTSGTINAISCSVSGVPTQTSVTLSIEKCLDGGFYNGYVEWWLGTDDPDTDLPQGHSYFQETDGTVTVTGLAAGTEYIFRVSATLNDMQTVARSAYVRAATAHDYSNDYFYLENTYNGTNTLTMTRTGVPKTSDLSYSFDKITWTRFSLSASAETVSVPRGAKLYLRSSTGFQKDRSNLNTFKMSKTHKAGGHIASLIDYTRMGSYSTIPEYSLNCLFDGDTNLTDASDIDFTGVTSIEQYGCYAMFNGCTSLAAAPALPATTLADSCYYGMFSGCTSLSSAPALPATMLAERCYQGMFSGCTSLTTAPTLSVTTLAAECYMSMFGGCRSLASAPALPATTMAASCYYSMFYDCTSLTAAPVLPATTLAAECYREMFSGCTSLSSAPALSVTTLADSCYYGMFSGCTSLTAAPVLPATTMADSCYMYMFRHCKALASTPTLPATTLADSCYYGMFSSCTSLRAAPSLPAAKMTEHCYCSMFYGCTSLTAAPALSATTLERYCYDSMFRDCTSLTTAHALPATALTYRCYYYMFSGCTSLTAAPDLPAKTLASSCYYGMFSSCTSLTAITCLATDKSASNCTAYWVYNVAASGTFTKDASMSGWKTGQSGIPSGWTVRNR